MALPKDNSAYPPADFRPLTRSFNEYAAWWSGDPDALASTYANYRPGQVSTTPQMVHRGGIVNRIAGFFWSRPIVRDKANTQKMHVPVASQIAQKSADLLYATPPKFTTPTPDGDSTDTEENETTANTLDRINEYVDAGLFATLAEGAEIGAAMGGRYHVVTLVPGINDGRPFLDTLDPSEVIPEFKWGRLNAATIVRNIGVKDGQTMRHVERHELTDTGMGIVYHALYAGTGDSIGRTVPLTDHELTAPLADVINPDGTVGAPSPGLAVQYVPNIRPQRKWRTNEYGRNMGRSDFETAIPLMDALDETWTSWMRDIRLGKARILVAASMLEAGGPGEGATFDTDREIYSPMHGVLANTDGGKLPLEAVQFRIRVDEHAKTVSALHEQIINAAGYSPASFGDHAGDVDITATEVKARQERTLATRNRKIRNETAPVIALVRKMLTLDMDANPAIDVDPDAPLNLEFPTGISDTVEETARAIQMFRTARAISIKTAVGMAHPDWDSTQVDTETAQILAEENGAEYAYPGEWQPPAPLIVPADGTPAPDAPDTVDTGDDTDA